MALAVALVSCKKEEGGGHVERGVLINGVTWARCNVDTPGTFVHRPEHSGRFYQWNRDKGWSSTNPAAGVPVADWDTTNPAGDSWEAENDPCPEGWRVPTNDDFITLFDQNEVRLEAVIFNGLNGVRAVDKSTLENIFLPTAGCRYYDSGVLDGKGTFGYYWSASPVTNIGAMGMELNFVTGMVNYDAVYRTSGFSVRCVSDQ